jgi:hypothetical protein
VNARNKFELGDRVGVTALGTQRHIGQESLRGTVVGFSRDTKCVRIIKDGTKYPMTYHQDFWYVVSRVALEGK